VVALAIGTVLAVSALAFVLYPLFFGAPRSRPRGVASPNDSGDTAIAALREIEFDRATGKLSDTDYAELKSRYTRDAVLAMRAKDGVGGGGEGGVDEIDAAVAAYRAAHPECRACGPRPETDAVFCSNCGRYLRDRCADCGAPVEALDARYCVSCGRSLAA
jgi:hypothetical protein